MCGIGLVYCNEINPVKISLIARNELTNRGPTWTIEKFDESLFLHQSVLAIQSDAFKLDKRINKIDFNKENKHILYNGEIFTSESLSPKGDFETLKQINDIEKLETFLKTVDGMFSIINVEFRYGNFEVNAFRDVIGEKRLYYYFNKNKRIFILSSTSSFVFKVIKSLGLEINLNHNSILDYFQKRHYINNYTSIDGINLLDSGSKLNFNSQEFSLKINKYDSLLRFYDQSFYQEIKNMQNNEYFDYLSEIMNDELLQMNDINNKDVLQNYVFSGGIDSSLVAAICFKEKRIRVDNFFTLTFGDKDPVSVLSSDLIKNWDINHVIHDVDIGEYFYALNRCIELQSSPVSTHSLPSSYILARLCRYSAQSQSCVLVGGEGADELFLGYPYYLNSLKNRSISNAIYSDNLRGNRSFLKKSKYDTQEEINVEEFFISQEENALCASIRRNAFCDYKYQLPNVGLAAADVVSSDLGIEFRTPFTRRKLIKLAFNTPTNKLLDINKNFSKAPLHQLFKKEFKKDPLIKTGFSGYPNELENELNLKNSIRDVEEFLSNKFGFFQENRDTRWKKINVAIFCKIHGLKI